MGTIQLEGMEFFAFHGCFNEEQIIGSKFLIDLEVEAETHLAEASDRLLDTVDYVIIYQKVKQEMAINSFLIEHVARRIIDSIRLGIPSISCIRLKIAKINPPIGGKIHQVCYKTDWKE
ncbi:MAG: dihydroneopterin aldolase [Bacteroidota bacterium]